MCIYNQCCSYLSQYQDMHCSEPWFHGHMREGRVMAERLIQDYCAETGGRDGTFLVRPSDTYVTDFTLSFWYNFQFVWSCGQLQQKLKDCSLSCNTQSNYRKYLFQRLWPIKVWLNLCLLLKWDDSPQCNGIPYRFIFFSRIVQKIATFVSHILSQS